MHLTYNKFKQVVDNSSEKLFNKIAEAVSTSDNAALVAMYDDKLILLDEENEKFFLCDYLFENGVLTIHKFESVSLTEPETAQTTASGSTSNCPVTGMVRYSSMDSM